MRRLSRAEKQQYQTVDHADPDAVHYDGPRDDEHFRGGACDEPLGSCADRAHYSNRIFTLI